MPDVVITMGLVLSAIALDEFVGTSERTYRRRRLEERTKQTDQAIYRLYFGDSGIPSSVVMDTWHEVANLLYVDAGRLRPADTLCGVLGFHKRFRGSRSDIEILLRHAHSRAEDGNLPHQQFQTVDDLVRCLSRVKWQRCMIGSGGLSALPAA